MHTIEPYFNWREIYVASEDESSPFFGATYNEFQFTQKIYNYFIHPQWDDFGSPTLYCKILYTSYSEKFTVIELIGEWNDCINNDIMFLKQNVIDTLLEHDIKFFILIGENVLNYHGDDDCYYEEWRTEVEDVQGWITFINFNDHVCEEMRNYSLDHQVHLGIEFNEVTWRGKKPEYLFQKVINRMESRTKFLDN